jgi:hypothetical protein
MIAALHPSSSLSSRLHRRQQQADQYADNRDHHEQFDQCEARRGV